MLDVAGAAEAGREQLLLVGDRVAVGVGVLPHLVGVRLHRQDRVGAERHHEAREDQLVDEHGVLLVDAVVVGVLVHRDAAGRLELAGRVGVLHVAANLDDEHPAVAVEGNLHRLFDVGLGQDRLDPVAGRQHEPLLLFGRRHRRDRVLRRQVRAFERIAAAPAARLSSAGLAAPGRLERRRLAPARGARDGGVGVCAIAVSHPATTVTTTRGTTLGLEGMGLLTTNDEP